MHASPWLYPHEIVLVVDVPKVFAFLWLYLVSLPCRYCRESSLSFIQDMDLFHSLFVTLPDGRKVITRGNWAKQIWILHNLVNKRLNKPQFGKDWTDSVYDRKIETSLWTHLFSIACNFETRYETDKQVASVYVELIESCIPWLLRTTIIAKPYNSFIKNYPLIDALGNGDMFEWVYELRKHCRNTEHWSLNETSRWICSFKALSKGCSSNLPIEAGKEHKGCN